MATLPCPILRKRIGTGHCDSELPRPVEVSCPYPPNDTSRFIPITNKTNTESTPGDQSGQQKARPAKNRHKGRQKARAPPRQQGNELNPQLCGWKGLKDDGSGDQQDDGREQGPPVLHPTVAIINTTAVPTSRQTAQ